MSDEQQPTGNQQKFAWIYDLGANKELSATAKTVATLAALKMAGQKGHFKASHKAIADLCGMSHRTARRAVDELFDRWYWEVESGAGGANTYTIIPPDERLEMWLDEERDWENECRKWEQAKDRWEFDVKKWLKAEATHFWLEAEAAERDNYITTIFDALIARGAYYQRAWDAAEGGWSKHRDSDGAWPTERVLAEISQIPDDKFEEIFGRPASTQPEPAEADAATEMDSPLATGGLPSAEFGLPPGHRWPTPLSNSNSPTSENDHSHKYLKSLKDFKVLQEDSAATRALDARSAAASQEHTAGPPITGGSGQPCRLCRDGIFLDADDYPVVLLAEDDDGSFPEKPLECRHSLEANLAEIRRIENESGGYWGLAKTGWYEIDSQFNLSDEESISINDVF
jgi:hypothetical protein